MKSSSGKYYVGLDHIRAIAAFMVFSWHFMHGGNGYPVPFGYAPSFFALTLLNEGHTGVALFMTLSGYLFAKLLDGKKINYVSFIWSRFLRLAPLLVLVILVDGYKQYLVGNNLSGYPKWILAGAIKPSLPNGGWSITVEFHFYLLLPLLLFFSRKSKYSLLFVVCFAILARSVLHQELGQIQKLAFWTIVGRIDQFLFGIMAYQFRKYIAGRHCLVVTGLTLFAIFYWYFNMQGGFYKSPSYPSPNAIWIFMPALEGLSYALMIAWYDSSFVHSNNRISRFVALIGTCSYSIYLLHIFFVFELAGTINEYLIDISNFYVALIFSTIGFLLMVPIGYASYRFIESPFLRLRTRYIVPEKPGNCLTKGSRGRS